MLSEGFERSLLIPCHLSSIVEYKGRWGREPPPLRSNFFHGQRNKLRTPSGVCSSSPVREILDPPLLGN